MAYLPRPVHALAAITLCLAGGCSSPAATSPEQSPMGIAVTGVRQRIAVPVRSCDGPATSLSAALAAQLPARDPAHPNFDDRLAALSRRVPGGFAGVFYEDGRPVLLLTDPSQAADAKRALAGELPGFELAAAEPRAARWTFAQLYDWRRYLETQAIWVGTTGVTVADTDERANRVYFGTADQAARDRLVGRLAAMDLPCDLVLVGIDPPAFAF